MPAQPLDACERLRVVQWRTPERIGDHDVAQVVDPGWLELACESTDLAVSVLAFGIEMMREVKLHERADVIGQFERCADSREEGAGWGHAFACVVRTQPAQDAAFLCTDGGGRLAEIMSQHRKHEHASTAWVEIGRAHV